MSHPLNQNPPPSVTFVSMDGHQVHDVPTRVCVDSGVLYIALTDIQAVFPNVDRLLDDKDNDVLFMIDGDLQLFHPLRIEYKARTEYTVVDHTLLSFLEDGSKASQEDWIFLRIECLFMACLSYNDQLSLVSPESGYDFHQVTANIRHFSLQLRNQIQATTKDGKVSPLCKGRHEEILAEIDAMEKQVELTEQKRAFDAILGQVDGVLVSPGPHLFVVLPSNLATWIDKDPSTHRFRLYFMCDVKTNKSKGAQASLPGHKHFANHPGYNLLEHVAFFKKYGTFLHWMLRMLKLGAIENNNTVPALDTFAILWDNNSKAKKHQLDKNNMHVLVSKMIVYLQQHYPLRPKKRLHITNDDVRDIQQLHLDIQSPKEDGVAVGGLYTYSQHGFISWVCLDHLEQCLSSNPMTLGHLQEFARQHNGFLDAHRALLRVELASETDAQELISVLSKSKYQVYLSLNFGWDWTRSYLKRFMGNAMLGDTLGIEVEGITLEKYPEAGYLSQGIDVFLDSFAQRITLLHYPRRNEQYYYFRRYNLGLEVQTKIKQLSAKETTQHLSESDPFKWIGLETAVTNLVDTILAKDNNEIRKQFYKKELPTELARHGLTGLCQLKFALKRSRGTVDLESGDVIELQVQQLPIPRAMAHIQTLRRLTIEALEPRSEQSLSVFIQSSLQLEQVSIAVHDNNASFYRMAESILKMCHDRPTPFCLIMFERIQDTQGRCLVQMVTGAAIPAPVRASVGTVARAPEHEPVPMIPKVEQWEGGHVSTPPSLYSAKVLDALSQSFPWRLESFTLDVSMLSPKSMECVAHILGRSFLDHLHVYCNAVDASIHPKVEELLCSVQWPTVKSLVMSGQNVEQWIECMAAALANLAAKHPMLCPQLLYLAIEDNGLVPSPLSHSGALALHRLVYSNPLEALRLKNIEFQEAGDVQFVKDYL
ncbi:hypothetical protein BGZ94_006088 [Podila epigama]|nr:hypothetical protein BGZ94_006088 [Podila epigama]